MIYPKCKNIVARHPGNALGIRATGHIVPCCFFGSTEAWNDLKDLLGNDIDNLHISTGKTLDEFNKSSSLNELKKHGTQIIRYHPVLEHVVNQNI